MTEPACVYWFDAKRATRAILAFDEELQIWTWWCALPDDWRADGASRSFASGYRAVVDALIAEAGDLLIVPHRSQDLRGALEAAERIIERGLTRTVLSGATPERSAERERVAGSGVLAAIREAVARCWPC